ncbi:hypothetical protein Q765_07155 [Flavobacterium rivuli WB 3.3-2 = DSM 21788]|uniref:Glycosyl transferase family 1 domain-containing protein n=1 Tax=Flavobacterium rivuli WB 3.3-2 = DSM 21788 TaxID=1121895 RepID=A0A0A2M721_9FLAO|nr:glycosyltransferase family 4 protein [Flavobacterium rivuli]KGO87436.1 hypothetical protein Q765_07155 [Flavobacterium rivuli WB 3.3-2 = DSM 21788]
MKIGLFTPGIISLKLGAVKNRIELAESLKNYGWETHLMGRVEIGLAANNYDIRAYRESLKDYLVKKADFYDVVLYEYDTLPYDRSLFSKKTLFIARPALLHYNYETIKIKYDSKTLIKHFLKKLISLDLNAVSKEQRISNEYGEVSLRNADVIQVQSVRDKELLVTKGYSKNKILIVPNGISDERYKLFDEVTFDNRGDDLTIAFIGTFDFRKGAMDFKFIIDYIKKEFPKAKFVLLGTKGLFSTVEDVLRFLPKKYWNDISVYPRFEPLELPKYLSGCHIGIFPSYFESFGFGALEMMAAGLPVVSYAVSGPSDYAIPELLVPIGNKHSLAKKVVDLFKDKKKLALLSNESKIISKKYNWNDIAKKVSEEYKTIIEARL